MRARAPLAVMAAGLAAALAAAWTSAPAGGTAAGVPLERLVGTGLRLGDVVVAGDLLLFVAETTGQIRSSALDGSGLRRFARLPRHSEEMRCRVAPAGLGFTPGDVWCHGPDNVIWRIAPNGTAKAVATLPESAQSDGSVTFDTGGRFGGRLLAATGGSSKGVAGGTVYGVTPGGSVARIASYQGPGGAENLLVAPPSFGPDAGLLLISIDHLPEHGTAGSDGRLLALAPDGTVRTLLAAKGVGFNGLAALPAKPSQRPGGGLLLAETFSRSVWRVPAASLAPYAGAVIVSGESRLWLAAVTRRADGTYAARRIAAGPPPAAAVNFEGIASLG